MAKLEGGVDGKRQCEHRPGEKANENGERIEKDSAAVVFHCRGSAAEIVLEEKASQKFAVGCEPDGPVPGQSDGGSGEDCGEGAHRPAGSQEVQRHGSAEDAN